LAESPSNPGLEIESVLLDSLIFKF
jgi:hypothetical protein